MDSNTVAVVGAGGWGTALSIVLSDNFPKVDLWVREDEVNKQISSKGENITFLPGVRLPPNVVANQNIEHVVSNKSIIVLAVPSSYVDTTTALMEPYIHKDTIIVNAGKGFDPQSLQRLSLTIRQHLPDNPIAVISGPNHAEETGKRMPSATVVASDKQEVAETIQDALMTNYFRVYTNSDIVGVELGGALKNIIALAVGVADGLGFGDNTKAALMTRGLTEIARLGAKLGANPLTFTGLSGIGDLIVTCTSNHSRNRRCGVALGQNISLDDYLESTNMVVEGIGACKAAYQLSTDTGVEMPITHSLYRILFDGLNPQEAVSKLMERQKKHEIEEIGF